MDKLTFKIFIIRQTLYWSVIPIRSRSLFFIVTRNWSVVKCRKSTRSVVAKMEMYTLNTWKWALGALVLYLCLFCLLECSISMFSEVIKIKLDIITNLYVLYSFHSTLIGFQRNSQAYWYIYGLLSQLLKIPSNEKSGCCDCSSLRTVISTSSHLELWLAASLKSGSFPCCFHKP